MTTSLSTRMEGRRLVMADGDTPCLTLPLDQGGRHRLVVGDSATAHAVVAALEACPGVRILPGGGGLLGDLAGNVAEPRTAGCRTARENCRH